MNDAKSSDGHWQPRPGTKAAQFLDLAQPGTDGFSKEVLVQEMPDGLQLGNGGGWCRDSGPLAQHYNVVRRMERGRIVAVALEGYQKRPISKPIPLKIRQEIKRRRCVVLGISEVECDHKDGRLDDPRLNDPKQVTLDDFQPLSKAANTAKRQHCRKCRETNDRFDAQQLGYPVSQWKGSAQYHGSCVGCYWHDPYAFNRAMSSHETSPV